MALKGIDRKDLPVRTSTGGQTSVPEEEQGQLLALVTNGQSASDGGAYATAKDARRAAGPYQRFLKAQIKAGTLQGTVHLTTFPAGKKDKDGNMTEVGWAIYVE